MTNERKEWIESRKQYERGLWDAIKKYVKQDMTAESKDKIFKIAQPTPFHYEIIKKNPNYEELRDAFVARDLLAAGLSYEIPIEKLDKKFVDNFIKDWNKIELNDRLTNNAIKGLNKFPDKIKEILAITGEKELNVNNVKYLGGDQYLYNDFILISFTRSPISIDIRLF
ncbi:MAG: hypothetical protein IKU67_01400 [Firmicutes bacterium]|nr:hypothetical protein [Bacillota bacterium]